MFAIVWCLQVVVGVTSSFWAVCVHFRFVFFVMQTLLDMYCARINLLNLVVAFLLLFFGSFRDCIFCSVNRLATRIYACSFSFALASLLIFLPLSCLCTSIPYRKPLAYPPSLQMIPSDQHDHRSPLPVFLHCVHPPQNIPFSAIWGSLYLVFTSLLDYTSIPIHPNQFTPICAHSHHFSPNSPKRDVWGNFTDHGGRKDVPLAHFCLFVPCFAVRPCPLTPAHPCKPIGTYFQPYLCIYSLFMCVFIYNLTKKY